MMTVWIQCNIAYMVYERVVLFVLDYVVLRINAVHDFLGIYIYIYSRVYILSRNILLEYASNIHTSS